MPRQQVLRRGRTTPSLYSSRGPGAKDQPAAEDNIASCVHVNRQEFLDKPVTWSCAAATVILVCHGADADLAARDKRMIVIFFG
ncbi:unnamed protein product [Urochloa humidicola]